jgi:hypothetical protein
LEILGLVLFLIIALFALLAKSPTARGNRGERRVNAVLASKLPSDKYAIFHDVTLDSSHGATQVDHIVVSRYGVFVIETKNYSGWIFGSANHKQWTQVLYRRKHRFMNPLRQNYKHTEAVKRFLSLDDRYVFSVVVFAGTARIKTDVPANVIYLRDLAWYILYQENLLLSPDQFDSMVTRLVDHIEGRRPRKTPSHLSVVDTSPSCPRCGEKMMLRTAKKGANPGEQFWGCPKFPGCRGTRKY